MIYIKQDFYSNLVGSIEAKDPKLSTDLVLSQLAQLVAQHPEYVVEVFQASGIPFDVQKQWDAKSISDLILKHAPTNKKLTTGLAYLMARQNNLTRDGGFGQSNANGFQLGNSGGTRFTPPSQQSGLRFGDNSATPTGASTKSGGKGMEGFRDFMNSGGKDIINTFSGWTQTIAQTIQQNRSGKNPGVNPIQTKVPNYSPTIPLAQPKDNTGLYVSLGVGGVILVGGLIFLYVRKNKAA